MKKVAIKYVKAIHKNLLFALLYQFDNFSIIILIFSMLSNVPVCLSATFNGDPAIFTFTEPATCIIVAFIAGIDT